MHGGKLTARLMLPSSRVFHVSGPCVGWSLRRVVPVSGGPLRLLTLLGRKLQKLERLRSGGAAKSAAGAPSAAATNGSGAAPKETLVPRGRRASAVWSRSKT